METNDYWKQFLRSGSVMDYLVYRGVDVCGQSFLCGSLKRLSEERAGEGEGDGFSHSYGYGVVTGSGGRI